MMATRQRFRETPYQDFSRIKNSVFIRRAARGRYDKDDIFTDPSFPPDCSSLTYVYSGDDKYERTVFTRPTEICNQPVFIGVGGVIDEPFPWKYWRQRSWFQAAIVIISLNVRFLDRLVPGYKVFEQNFDSDYIGAFRFTIWRFTEWVEIIIDDYLPMLDGVHLFCRAIGSPPEFWGSLVEKAYAKCKKTFQAIEYGNMLDALTDLTGCVCEYYTPDVNPADNLFHIMFKSHGNRSMMVCWRNDKRITPVAFEFEDSQKAETDWDDAIAEGRRYLHLITATTKFPTTDGRMIEMIRLRCPYAKEPKWHGKYSDKDTNSWNRVSADFKDKFRPLSRKEEDEYWLTMEDFRCNFGGLVIISSTEIFHYESLTVQRNYTMDNEPPVGKTSFDRNKFMFSNQVQQSLSLDRQGSDRATRLFHEGRRGCCKVHMVKTSPLVSNCSSGNGVKRLDSASPMSPDKTYTQVTQVLEFTHVDIEDSQRTVVMDCTSLEFKDKQKPPKEKTRSVKINSEKDCDGSDSNTPVNCRIQVPSKERKSSLPPDGRDKPPLPNDNVRRKSNPGIHKPPLPFCVDNDMKRHTRVGSAVSNNEISLHIRGSLSVEDTSRPQSAPLPRNLSSGSLSSLTPINFLATKADFFRSHGRWKNILEYKDKWTKNKSGVPPTNIEVHSKSPRILLHVFRADASDIISPSMQYKRHVLISVLQDYRHGPSTANSLLVPIGFCLYRTKNPDRDEKRHVTKLHLVAKVEGKPEIREVNARFDLEHGSYFIVPYYAAQAHEGEYLIRVLTECDPPGGKASCSVS